jgi:hypothetical protein
VDEYFGINSGELLATPTRRGNVQLVAAYMNAMRKMRHGVGWSVALGAMAAQLLARPSESARWSSVVTGQPIETISYQPQSNVAKGAWPVILYLQNLAAPRIGTIDDETLIREYRDAGYWVVVLDYAHAPQARVPFLNRDLGKLRDDINGKRFLAQHAVDSAHVFIVPSGSRIKRDVVFFRDEKRTLAMDIIYPAQPAKPVGTVLEFSCDNKDRFGNNSLSICSDTILDGEATEGLAVAMADHPVAPPYKGIDAMPDSAWKIKAAVRTLRSQSKTIGLNEKIVPVGFSRGSGMALMLVTTEGKVEFEGHGENPEEKSTVDGAVVLSGRFTYLDLLESDHMIPLYTKLWGERRTHAEKWKQHGALDYLLGATVPLFLSINISESPDALYQMKGLRQRLAEVGNDVTFLMDRTPRGHKVPLDPAILGPLNEYLKDRLGDR